MKVLVALEVFLVVLFAPAINGLNLQDSSCNATILNDFPDCLNSFGGFLENAPVDEAAIDLLCTNTSCQMAIEDFVNSCTNITFQQVLSTERASIALGCTAIPDGGVCFDRLQYSSIDMLGNVSSICVQEYSMGICSEYCVQAITTLTNQLGCCYNEEIRSKFSLAPETPGLPNVLNVLVSDYFVLCGLTAQTFCQNYSTIAPDPCSVAIQGLFGRNDNCSNLARQLIASGGNLSNVEIQDVECLMRLTQFGSSCNINFTFTECQMATIELFDSSDNCSQAFSVLPRNTVDRITFDSANTAMNTICGTAGCRRRISRFVRCLPDVDIQQFEIFILDFGCRINDEGSCFAVQQRGVLDSVTTAFNVDQRSGECSTAIFGSCSDECSTIIRDAIRDTGCCVNEFARAGVVHESGMATPCPVPRDSYTIAVRQLFGLPADNINRILVGCGITTLQPCVEQMEGQFRMISGNNVDDNDDGNIDASTGSSASMIVDYIFLTSLLALCLIVNI